MAYATAEPAKWFAFTAHNTQAVYGCGTEDEASAYQDYLNAGRDVNHYSYRPLTEREVADINLEGGDAGVNLDEELAAIRDAA